MEDFGHALKTSIGYILSRLLWKNRDVLHMRCRARIILSKRPRRGCAYPLRRMKAEGY